MFEVLKKCFAINLNDYENINFNLEINKVIFGAFCALMVGVVILSIYRGTICIGFADDAGGSQHRRMGHRAGNVLAVHSLVKTNGGIKVIRNFIYLAVGSAGPHFCHNGSPLISHCRESQKALPYKIFQCDDTGQQ